ncbi:Flp pilus assembly protein CpaB [Rhizobiales bacterium]|uniref:Flp pilus assembly protein CpaB n=1 Tax=Hongsoonwoonella zoysiae TaxID=2821844 RepID=UPI00155FBB5F|nr:Flp pilus assembly protein CpaB [Hongsoonwoonella zoysiae]NRG16135.1 Flp pilus assembly protein CpaB [Hongsoonwoonella zoysiae]
MKIARIAILGVALGAGLLAARLVISNSSAPPQEVIVEAPATGVEQVLVASRDIKLGSQLAASDLTWADWPKNATPSGAILRSRQPDAAASLSGRIARAPLYSGEPLREERLIATDRGFMAAILPKGQRAIAVPVEAVTTAGGFILPGDKVDLILTRAQNGRSGDGFLSETILANVRVLAIDTTTAGEQDEKALPPGRTATLELSPEQAEVVTRAQQIGTISLALRSAADSADDADDGFVGGGVNFVKYGLTSQASTLK